MYTINILILHAIMWLHTDAAFNKTNIVETMDPILAEQLFKKYGTYYPGIWKEMHNICSSLFVNSNRIYGDAVCYGIRKKLQSGVNSYAPRTSCVRMTLILRDKSKTYMNGVSLKLASCTYKSKGGNIQIFVGNAPKKDYYYLYQFVDEYETAVELLACVAINLQDVNIPIIKIGETPEPAEADDIFGIYGQNSDIYRRKHVCRLKSRRVFATPEEMFCRKVMNRSGYVKRNLEQSLKIPVRCEAFMVKRRIISSTTDAFKKTRPIYMIKCDYSYGFFAISNGPRENLYYIAEKSDDPQDNPFLVSITSVIKIENI